MLSEPSTEGSLFVKTESVLFIKNRRCAVHWRTFCFFIFYPLALSSTCAHFREIKNARRSCVYYLSQNNATLLTRDILHIIMYAKYCELIYRTEDSMLDALKIGYTIKDARSKLNLTQAQLAEAAGISKRCLWSLELGQNSGVQLDKLLAVFKVLGLDLQIVISETPVVKVLEGETKNASALPEQDIKVDALSILTGGQHDIS